MPVLPIKPSQVSKRKSLDLPDQVVEVFNALIDWNGSSATVLEDQAASRIPSALGISRDRVFSLSYLDVEDLFRSSGWEVTYDKPGYNEDYEATFCFRKRKKRE